MNNPTHEECRQLAEAFDEFVVDEDEFNFWLGQDQLRFYPAQGGWELEHNFAIEVSSEIGLAALTAKCKEIVRGAGYAYSETDTGICFGPLAMERDSAWEALIDWAALLATQNTGAASTSI